MTSDLEELFNKASENILSQSKDTRIRVISHYDADGITSAAILSKTLYRAGFDFHVTLMRNPFDKGLERVSKEENQLIIFTDMGSGQIETIEKMKTQSIIIDHHQPIKNNTTKNVFQINCNLFGINGNYEACGSTLTFGLSYTLDPQNIDLAPLAIVGATGDKQYIGGFRGYNQKIIDEALNKSNIHEKTGIKFSEESLYNSLINSVEPYYSGISGDKTGISNLFKKTNIEKNINFKDLKQDEIKKLHSYLMLCLIKSGCENNILDTVIRKRFYSENIGFEFERFADLIDSCGKGGDRSLGLSVALGDEKSIKKALEHEKKYKEKILDELIRLDRDGVQEKNGIRFFYSNDSSLGGVIGGIAMNFIFDREKPLLSIVRNKDEIHVSCRGTQYLVSKGLDLGKAMKSAAQKLGGHGGGHAIASGATISSEKEEEFLKIVDKILVKQIMS
jgi:RecJ-like exonuclease